MTVKKITYDAIKDIVLIFFVQFLTNYLPTPNQLLICLMIIRSWLVFTTAVKRDKHCFNFAF